MSDDYEDDQIEEPSALRRQLEERTREAADAQTRLAALERKEAFRDAGLDPNSKQHQAFIKAYDGDITPDAITNYVTELGIDQPANVTPAPAAVPQEERDAMARITEASAGDGQPPPPTDREKEIRAEMEIQARKGNNAELDRLSNELTRVRGFQTLTDLHPI